MLTIHTEGGESHAREMSERFLAGFLAALDDVGIPDDPQLRAALRAYMEWATSEVEGYMRKDSEVAEGMPSPRTVTLDRYGHLFPKLDEALTDRLDAMRFDAANAALLTADLDPVG